MGYPPLELAHAFIKTGELQDALDALQAHLTAAPHDDDARRLLIETLLRLPNSAHWLDALETSHELEQLTAADWVMRSILYEKLADLPAAQTCMKHALALDPSERLIERQLHLLQATGDYHAAAQLLETMPQTWHWQERRADLAAHMGQPQDAIRLYTAALDALAAHADTDWQPAFIARLRLARGQIALDQKAYADAEADYQAAALLMPDEPIIPFQLGIIALRKGDLASAQTLCRRAYQQAGAWIQAEMRQQLTDTPDLAPLMETLLGVTHP